VAGLVIFLLVGLSFVLTGIGTLPAPLLAACFLFGAAQVARSLLAFRRQLAPLRRHTRAMKARYPEEFSAVASLLAELSERFGRPAPELVVSSNETLGSFALLDRLICVPQALLASMSRSEQKRSDGEFELGHELGHVVNHDMVRQTLVYIAARALRAALLVSLLVVGWQVLAGQRPVLMLAPLALLVILLDLAAVSLEHLVDAAAEIDADRVTARVLGHPEQQARGLASMDLRNALAALDRGVPWRGARQIIAALHSLGPVWPELRIDGVSLTEMAQDLREQMKQEGPRSFREHLIDLGERARDLHRNGLVSHHPLSGDRVRLLCGRLSGMAQSVD